MTMSFKMLLGCALVTGTLLNCYVPAAGQQPTQKRAAAPKVIRDMLWVWGNPEMTKEGQHTLATFAQASPAQRARLLGAPNIIMAGLGIPNDDQEAERLTQEVASSPRLIWEIAADGEGGPPFVYQERMAQVRRLVDQFPNIEGVVLDDMSSAMISKGFKPEHIRQIRQQLSGKYSAVKLWGVVYTMNLDIPNINEYIKEVDVILFCEWFGKKIGDLEKNIAHLEQTFPDKSIVLGLYLYDYGDERRMPQHLLEKQFEIALRLAHAGRIQGIEITTIDNDPEALTWTAKWIKQVGNQKIGSQ